MERLEITGSRGGMLVLIPPADHAITPERADFLVAPLEDKPAIVDTAFDFKLVGQDLCGGAGTGDLYVDVSGHAKSIHRGLPGRLARKVIDFLNPARYYRGRRAHTKRPCGE